MKKFRRGERLRLTTRLPISLRKELDEEAQEQGVAMGEVVIRALEGYLGIQALKRVS